MSTDVTLPLWLVLIAGALAIWAALTRLLVPGVRWYAAPARQPADRRDQRGVCRCEIPPFKLHEARRC